MAPTSKIKKKTKVKIKEKVQLRKIQTIEMKVQIQTAKTEEEVAKAEVKEATMLHTQTKKAKRIQTNQIKGQTQATTKTVVAKVIIGVDVVEIPYQNL